MNSTRLYRAVIACLVLYAGASAQPTSEKMRKQNQDAKFQRHANEWMQAYNSKDAANLASFYTEDANYISSHVPGLVARGRDKVEENFRKGMSSGGHIDTIVVVSSALSCHLAYIHSRYEATNSGQKAIGQSMLVLKKIDGRWLIKEHMTVVVE